MDSPWTMKYYFYTFKNPTARTDVKKGISSWIYYQTDMQNLWLYSGLHVSYQNYQISSCIRNVLYQNWSPQAGKRENWQFVDLSRLQFIFLTNRNLSPITFRLPWWKNIENLTCIFVKNNLEMHECHNFRHVFRGTIDFCESYTSYTRINYTCF